MEARYEKGSHVIYSYNGVCLIEDIRKMEFPHDDDPKDFYVLRPISEPTSTIFVPTDNGTLTDKMRHTFRKKEVNDMILSVKGQEIPWIEDRNARASTFQNILKRCDICELLQLVSCMYLQKQLLADNKKRLSTTDENVMRKAEGLVENEFSFVLQVSEEQVGRYIRELLEIDEAV